MAHMRNIALLSGAQAIAGSSQGMVMAVGALAAASLLVDMTYATVPTTVMIVCLALSAGPAAIILHRVGRTRGLMLGMSVAVIGALIVALAVYLEQFLLFAAGFGLIGASAAFGQQIRFAAADSVPPDLKARAVSWVMFGGVLSGFLGPGLAGATANIVPGAQYSGSFIALAAMVCIGVAFVAFTDLPKGQPKPEPGKSGRPFSQLIKDPDIFVRMLTGMASFALMTFVMVAAPLAMVYWCGHTPGEAATAIQWHIVAMFAPSFITGTIINRIGTHFTVAIGLLLILASAGIALTGISVLHFNIALILLGVGWNFGFIGSTVMLTRGYRPEEGARAQALNEQVVFGGMALASIGAGVLLNRFGWEAVNLMVMPIVAAVLLLLAWTDLRGRRLKREAATLE